MIYSHILILPWKHTTNYKSYIVECNFQERNRKKIKYQSEYFVSRKTFLSVYVQFFTLTMVRAISKCYRNVMFLYHSFLSSSDDSVKFNSNMFATSWQTRHTQAAIKCTQWACFHHLKQNKKKRLVFAHHAITSFHMGSFGSFYIIHRHFRLFKQENSDSMAQYVCVSANAIWN